MEIVRLIVAYRENCKKRSTGGWEYLILAVLYCQAILGCNYSERIPSSCILNENLIENLYHEYLYYVDQVN